MNSLELLLQKIPMVLLTVLSCAYLGYNHYDFLVSDSSELGVKRAKVHSLKRELDLKQKKWSEAQVFFQSLEDIRGRIKNAIQELSSIKGTISQEVDLTSFVNTVNLEAKKVQLNIRSIHPELRVKKDQYMEIPFEVKFRATYLQTVLFLEKILGMTTIYNVQNLEMKTSGNPHSRFVDLDVSMKLSTYKYIESSVDTVLDNSWMKSNQEGLNELKKAGRK